jgi:hypothetical protein
VRREGFAPRRLRPQKHLKNPSTALARNTQSHLEGSFRVQSGVAQSLATALQDAIANLEVLHRIWMVTAVTENKGCDGNLHDASAAQ